MQWNGKVCVCCRRSAMGMKNNLKVSIPNVNCGKNIYPVWGMRLYGLY
jgi:hypothetical protein